MVLDAGPGGRHARTLVTVLGDHGQTAGGEHGGGTPAETNTVLLALSAAELHRRRATCALLRLIKLVLLIVADHQSSVHSNFCLACSLRALQRQTAAALLNPWGHCHVDV